MKKLIAIIYFPLALPHLLVFILSKERTIIEDINRWNQCTSIRSSHRWWTFWQLIVFFPEFRTLFYYRLGKLGMVLNLFLRRHPVCYIAVKQMGGGCFIQHGFSTILYANKIGENLWVNQNVTIGHSGKGIPEIGDNVHIGAGAIVIGPIKIGNNVRIGAGAIVVNDIPDNSVVISNKAHILKK